MQNIIATSYELFSLNIQFHYVIKFSLIIQILSVGAELDTSYFRLKSNGKTKEHHPVRGRVVTKFPLSSV